MPIRTIHYYEFPDRQPDWTELKRVFKGNLSKFNVPFFEAGSDNESKFRELCNKADITTRLKTLIDYDGRSGENADYLYLTLKDDEGKCISDHKHEFIDYSGACPGGGAFGVCCRGAKQVGRVAVNASGLHQVNRHGLLVAQYPLVPKIFLLSEEVAGMLQDAKATGCEIAPCAIHGISEAATAADACFQLKVLAETPKAAKIGEAQLGKRCPVCGAVKFFLSTAERYFCEGDLLESDFQLCRAYEADNVGRFEVADGFPIVSKRTLDLLLKYKVKGLTRYSTDPPITHAVVQVQK